MKVTNLNLCKALCLLFIQILITSYAWSSININSVPECSLHMTGNKVTQPFVSDYTLYIDNPPVSGSFFEYLSNNKYIISQTRVCKHLHVDGCYQMHIKQYTVVFFDDRMENFYPKNRLINHEFNAGGTIVCLAFKKNKMSNKFLSEHLLNTEKNLKLKHKDEL